VLKVHCNHIIPVFLKDAPLPDSEVWGQSFELTNGLRYLIEAPSGKGKSTFLGLLYGTRSAASGEILWNDEKTNSWNDERWSAIRREKVSMLFQEMRLFDMLTVRQNLQMKIELSNHVSIETAVNWLDELGLNGFLDRECRTLSYGQQQRVAIVRALCQPFEWLLLDEPFSHLDQENALRAMALIDRIRDPKSGVIITSLGQADDRMFDRLLRL
jgi:ABC-type lipoprotein export system ATPase subunit